MELWIRTQDKLNLIPIHDKLSINFIDYVGNYLDPYNLYTVCYKKEELGTYTTKERALEVLDEIQNILMPKILLNPKTIMPNGDIWEQNGVVYQNCNAEAKWEQPDTFVYEMPKE